MRAKGRITPALPLKELNRSLFITADFGQVFNDVRFCELRMFFIIHGIIFHDEVGHWLGNPRKKREYVGNANWRCLQKGVFLKMGNRVDGSAGKKGEPVKASCRF